MAKSKLKPLGTHLEYSPDAKKRFARSMNRQEKRWSAKSGPVTERNIFIDELVIQIAAHKVADTSGQFDLSDLIGEIAQERSGYDADVIVRTIDSRLVRGDDSPLIGVQPGVYRIRKSEMPATY